MGRRQLQGLVVDVLVQLAAEAYEALLSPAEQRQHKLALLAEAQALAGDSACTDSGYFACAGERLGPGLELGFGLGLGRQRCCWCCRCCHRCARSRQRRRCPTFSSVRCTWCCTRRQEGGPKAVITDPAGQDTGSFTYRHSSSGDRRRLSLAARGWVHCSSSCICSCFANSCRGQARRVHCLQLGSGMNLDMLPVLEFFCKGDAERDNAQYWAQQPADDAVSKARVRWRRVSIPYAGSAMI